MEYVKVSADALEGCPPQAGAFLLETGLPRKVITIFEAASEIAKTSRDVAGREVVGIVLGFSREGDELFLDYENGKVWLLASWRPGAPFLTNSSVGKFVKSLVSVGSAYPFYPSDRDLDTAERAEYSLRHALEEIDSVSTADPDGFWSAFLGDVGVGDYSGPGIG